MGKMVMDETPMRVHMHCKALKVKSGPVFLCTNKTATPGLRQALHGACVELYIIVLQLH